MKVAIDLKKREMKRFFELLAEDGNELKRRYISEEKGYMTLGLKRRLYNTIVFQLADQLYKKPAPN